MKLSIKAFALATGILWGLALFAGTLMVVYGDGYLEHIMGMFVGAYPWYELTLAGAFIGLVEGFIDGAIGGAIFAWLYNKLLKCCKEK